jgi:hypothetical protein
MRDSGPPFDEAYQFKYPRKVSYNHNMEEVDIVILAAFSSLVFCFPLQKTNTNKKSSLLKVVP